MIQKPTSKQIQKGDYVQPVVDDLSTPMLLGQQPSIIGGSTIIGMSGAAADNIWTQQYSAGGSILDALLDKPEPRTKVAPKAPPAPTTKVLRSQQTDGGGEGLKDLFNERPAFKGFLLGVFLILVINKYA